MILHMLYISRVKNEAFSYRLFQVKLSDLAVGGPSELSSSRLQAMVPVVPTTAEGYESHLPVRDDGAGLRLSDGRK